MYNQWIGALVRKAHAAELLRRRELRHASQQLVRGQHGGHRRGRPLARQHLYEHHGALNA